MDECEEGILRSLGEGGYASEGFARRSAWRGATGVSPWSSTLDEVSGIPIVEGTCGWAQGRLISQMDSGERFIVLAQIEKEMAHPSKQSLRVRDLAQHLSTAILQKMQEKYLQDVERDRRTRAQPS